MRPSWKQDEATAIPSEVIDRDTSGRDADVMRPKKTKYDSSLRVIMWLDAFWSVAAVLVSVAGSVAVAVLGLPQEALGAVAATSLVAGVFLAATGAITGILLMLRLHAGHYFMPPSLKVPLPRGMHPQS